MYGMLVYVRLYFTNHGTANFTVIQVLSDNVNFIDGKLNPRDSYVRIGSS